MVVKGSEVASPFIVIFVVIIIIDERDRSIISGAGVADTLDPEWREEEGEPLTFCCLT